MRRLLISEQEDLQLVKSYDFETLEEYFQYILESKENGQHKQARELYARLSTSESMQVRSGRQKFWDWVEVAYYYEAHDNDNQDFIIELKRYLTKQ